MMASRLWNHSKVLQESGLSTLSIAPPPFCILSHSRTCSRRDTTLCQAMEPTSPYRISLAIWTSIGHIPCLTLTRFKLPASKEKGSTSRSLILELTTGTLLLVDALAKAARLLLDMILWVMTTPPRLWKARPHSPLASKVATVLR